MFTVKLKKGTFTKIVGADRVHIRPCCISGLHGIETYYISHQPLTQENSFEIGEEFDAAYIENANGQTTERVHANN